MTDRIIAIAALATLIGFLGILAGFVPSTDLVIILAIVAVLAGYDFYRSLFRRRGRRK